MHAVTITMLAAFCALSSVASALIIRKMKRMLDAVATHRDGLMEVLYILLVDMDETLKGLSKKGHNVDECLQMNELININKQFIEWDTSMWQETKKDVDKIFVEAVSKAQGTRMNVDPEMMSKDKTKKRK